VDLVNTLCSKKEMFFLARKMGIPSPDCLFPESRAEVLEYTQRAAFPVMLKGIDGIRLERFAGKRMFLVGSAHELLEKYDALPVSERHNLMLQEYIPGGTETCWMFNGYFNERSDCLAGFTGQKIRQFPVYTGATCLGICTRNDDVAALTRRFMKAVGYRGILDIGYKLDSRDGQYKVYDVNPRIGATFRLFVARNGMDVARALYLDLTGQAVEADEAPEGRKWIVEDQDSVSSFRYWRDGKLKCAEWAKSFRGIREGGCWALDDPLPALGTILLDIGKAFEAKPAKPVVAAESAPPAKRVTEAALARGE
ncbi:MAG: hypothetical protein M3Z36_15545, partial [Acidobacteriota bacterium]|nr:hypothetical protein [Acidobacteriota bacterium]